MKICPIKVNPTVTEQPWGAGRLFSLYRRGEEGKRTGETTELSPALKVASGEFQGLTVSQLASRYGEEFTGGEQKGIPYRIRLLDAMHRTPVQIYPDEREAKGMHGHYGLAVILRAEVDAGLYAGLREGVSRAEYMELAAEGKLARVMNFLPAVRGDVFFLPGGLPVAVGGGITLLAVSRGSDERYPAEGADAEKNYAYLEKDLRAMKFVGKYEQDFFGQVRRFSYGTLYAEEIVLEGRWEGVTEDKLISLFIAEGEGVLEVGEEETPFAPGDVFLVPAEAVHYRLEGNARVYLFR